MRGADNEGRRRLEQTYKHEAPIVQGNFYSGLDDYDC